MKACLSAAAAGLVLLAAATCGRSREAGNADSRGAFGAAPQSVAAPATPGECGHSACADAFFIDVAPADCGATSMKNASADRKSTRLNSSHTVISYAVFCLKKKKKTTMNSHSC